MPGFSVETVSLGIVLSLSFVALAGSNLSLRPVSLVQQEYCDTCPEKKCFMGEDDYHWCCKCPPGTYLNNLCKRSEPNSTVCLPCEDNYYMSEYNTNSECYKSSTESLCTDLLHTHFVKGNKSVNNQCICNTGTYLDHDSICKPHLKCIKGFGVSIPGNLTHDTKCERCKDGYCSDTESSTEQCSICSDSKSSNVSSRLTTTTTTSSVTTSTSTSTTVEDDDLNITALSSATGGMNAENIAAIVVPIAVLLAIVLILLFYFCWWKKNRKVCCYDRGRDMENGTQSKENQNSNRDEGEGSRLLRTDRDGDINSGERNDLPSDRDEDEGKEEVENEDEKEEEEGSIHPEPDEYVKLLGNGTKNFKKQDKKLQENIEMVDFAKQKTEEVISEKNCDGDLASSTKNESESKLKDHRLTKEQYEAKFEEKGYRIAYDANKMGNGNCQFEAIVWVLKKTPTLEFKEVSALRKKIVDHIDQHPKQFEKSTYHENVTYVSPYKGFKQYINKMRKDGECGDHLTLQAASDILAVMITVIQTSSAEIIHINPKESKSNGGHILLGHIGEDEGAHYVCLEKLDDSAKPHPPSSDNRVEVPGINPEQPPTDNKEPSVPGPQEQTTNLPEPSSAQNKLQQPSNPGSNPGSNPEQSSSDNKDPFVSDPQEQAPTSSGSVQNEPLQPAEVKMLPAGVLGQPEPIPQSQLHTRTASPPHLISNMSRNPNPVSTTEDSLVQEIMQEFHNSDEQFNDELLLHETKKLLKDFKLGHKMLRNLINLDYNDVKEYLRWNELIEDGDVGVIEEDYRDSVRERRHRLIEQAIQKESRKLTPEYLLGRKYKYEVFNERVMDVFKEKLTENVPPTSLSSEQ